MSTVILLKAMRDEGLSLDQAIALFEAIEAARTTSLSAVVRAVMDAGRGVDIIIAACAYAESCAPPVRRRYERGPRQKAYGPASDPRAFQCPEKERAFAYASKFIVGSPVRRLPDREWLPLVGEVMRRDGFICTYCGADGDTYKLACDHIVPISRGGPNVIENLTTACDYCNSAKRDRLPQEWLA